MKKNSTKKSYPENEVIRYLGSLSENFQHGLSAIGEQFGGLNTKLDESRKTLDEHGRKLYDLTHKVDHISEVQNEHTRKLDNHAIMIARVMEDVEEIKSGMREKVDRSEFVKLEKRMVVLEATVFGGKKRVLNK